MTAYQPMQLAHAIDAPAAMNSEISHIQWLMRVIRILTAQRHQLLEVNIQPFLRIVPEIFVHKPWVKSVKSRSHSSMRCKKIPCSCNCHGSFEVDSCLLHIAAGPLEHGKGSV